jgi:hypothetical protein
MQKRGRKMGEIKNGGKEININSPVLSFAK